MNLKKIQQIQSFHGKLHFYSDYKTFGVVENSTPVIDSLDQINTKTVEQA